MPHHPKHRADTPVDMPVSSQRDARRWSWLHPWPVAAVTPPTLPTSPVPPPLPRDSE